MGISRSIIYPFASERRNELKGVLIAGVPPLSHAPSFYPRSHSPSIPPLRTQLFTRRILRTSRRDIVPRIQASLNSWDRSQGPNFLSLRLDFLTKMANSNEWDLSLRFVAGSSC